MALRQGCPSGQRGWAKDFDWKPSGLVPTQVRTLSPALKVEMEQEDNIESLVKKYLQIAEVSDIGTAEVRNPIVGSGPVRSFIHTESGVPVYILERHLTGAVSPKERGYTRSLNIMILSRSKEDIVVDLLIQDSGTEGPIKPRVVEDSTDMKIPEEYRTKCRAVANEIIVAIYNAFPMNTAEVSVA